MTIGATDPHNTTKKAEIDHPGMMGDGTEEQNLDERGNPTTRIKKGDVDAAFAERRPKQSWV